MISYIWIYYVWSCIKIQYDYCKKFKLVTKDYNLENKTPLTPILQRKSLLINILWNI